MPTLIAQNWSKRKREILLLTAQGHCAKSAARLLGLAVQTVKNIRADILYELDAKNMPEAISKAFEQQILRYIPALVLAFLTVLPSIAPVKADDDPVIRRARSRLTGRRITRYFDSSDPHALIWDDGEFIVQRTQEAS